MRSRPRHQQRSILAIVGLENRFSKSIRNRALTLSEGLQDSIAVLDNRNATRTGAHARAGSRRPLQWSP